MTTVGTLYSGVGGADLGFLTAGCTVDWQSEADLFRHAVLSTRFPQAAQFSRVDASIMRHASPVDVVYIDLPDWRVDLWWPPAWPVAQPKADGWLCCEFSSTVRWEVIARDLGVAGWAFRIVLGTFTTRTVEDVCIRTRAIVLANRDKAKVDGLGLLSMRADLDGAVPPVPYTLSGVERTEHAHGLPVGWTCVCGRTPCACRDGDRLSAIVDATAPFATNWVAQLLDGRWTDGRGLDRGVTQADGRVPA